MLGGPHIYWTSRHIGLHASEDVLYRVPLARDGDDFLRCLRIDQPPIFFGFQDLAFGEIAQTRDVGDEAIISGVSFFFSLSSSRAMIDLALMSSPFLSIAICLMYSFPSWQFLNDSLLGLSMNLWALFTLSSILESMYFLVFNEHFAMSRSSNPSLLLIHLDLHRPAISPLP